MDGEHSLVAADLERDLQTLRTGAIAWASLQVGRKIRILAECQSSVARNARRWTERAARLKGIAGTSLAGEEALTGPWGVLSALNHYAHTLAQIERTGSPLIDKRRVRSRAGGQTVVQVFPASVYDRLLNPGVSAEVWMQPGVTRENLPETMGAWYREPAPAPRVALVLGAGNITSIGLLDALYKLVAEGCATMLKVHPLLNDLSPIFEDAFAPLVAAGYLRFAYGGADLGGYLCGHRAIDEIHITGSQASYEAIAGANATGKAITSELGNVSPAIVVAGGGRDWSDAELRFQAEHLATAKLHNDGFNCVALQVLVLPARWNQRGALIAALRRVFQAAADRAAYYPGSAQRYATLVAGRAGVSSYGRDEAGFLARTILEADAADLGEVLWRTEAFAPLLAVVTIPGADEETYLKSAVEFCNERLSGNLAANLIVDPATKRRHARAVDDAIAELRYGCVGVNIWSGVGFLLPVLPWGAYPGNVPERIGSGTGVVHNSRLFSRSQKAVLYGPFTSISRQLKPPWFVTHRNQAEIAMALCDFEVARSPIALAKIAWLTLTG
jgi:aldehyde dehydrogenase (NAD(P)+)